MRASDTGNLDFLAACVHGRRSRMAEAERLEQLCQVSSLSQFATEIAAGVEPRSPGELQRQLVTELAREVAELARQTASPGADLLEWLNVRFQVENVKVLVRGVLAGVPWETLREHLLPLPSGATWAIETAAAGRSLAEIECLLPRGPLRRRFGEALGLRPEEGRPFFFEAALDRGYFEELLSRTEALKSRDRELLRPLSWQEADTFHLALVARGRFVHHLDAELLRHFHVAGSGISADRFGAMVTDADLRTAALRAVGHALDVLPASLAESGAGNSNVAPAELEACAWNRYLRLANRAFRRSHMGLPAVVAYVGIRRVEVANLIRLSEGIRARLAPPELHARLILRRDLEVARV